MTIETKQDNGRITVAVSGWLDVESTPQLHEAMESLPQAQILEFDFTNLEYISSAGVREVVAAYRRQKECGGTFEVTHAGPDVMEVFRMTGLDRKIPIS